MPAKTQMTPTQCLLRTLLNKPTKSITSKHQTKQLHALIIKLKPHYYPNHVSTLISLYSTFNLLHYSLLLFHSFPSNQPSVSAYKAIIKCYSFHGLSVRCLQCFVEMRASGKDLGRYVFPAVLKSCAMMLDVRLGEAVHGCVARLGMDMDLYTANALMNMYAKFGRSGKVFDEIPERRVGRWGHERGVKDVDGNGFDDICGNSGEIFRVDNVRKVFENMRKRDIVSWNTVIAGNAQNGLYYEALGMVREMGSADLKPDTFTLSSVLPIFAEYVNVNKGKEIHGYAVRHGLDGDVYIGSGLIDMYAKCTRLEDSVKVFGALPERDSISWNSVIAACVQNGRFDEGLMFFRRMVMARFKPMQVSFSSILPACSYLTTLCLGKQLHGHIIRVGYDGNVFIASSLVDMYAKCGNIRVARWIFDQMEQHDTVSWTAIIMAYAVHGQAQDAISLFEEMEMEGIKPNYVVFTAILTACSHAGLIDEAWRYFTGMSQHYGIVPGPEHYASMADLLGRAGRLNEAYELISSMHETTGAVWSALLSACRIHKNVELAEKTAEKVLQVDPGNIGAYVLLSNTYASARSWKDAAKVRILMRERGIKKRPACSWIEVKHKLHAFIAGDKSHPRYGEINEAWNVLLEKMEQEGYVPDTSMVLHDVEEDQKKELLFHHSERLAIAFGIISSPAGTTIRVTKNIRVCGDCHTVIKLISKIAERVIIVRDNIRFHHFVNGECSCRDYW